MTDRIPQRTPDFLRFTDLVDTGQLTGKRVFIRSDLNVPLDEHMQITDDTRIRASLPALTQALAAGAAVMVTSHLGRPTEGVLGPHDTLAPIAQRLSELLNRPVPLLQNWVEKGVDIQPGQIVLLENCRVNPGEKSNSEALGRTMAALCDVYVNDAFGTAHRAEATTCAIAHYAPIACAGPLLTAELDALSRALQTPRRPLVALVGGSKVSTKLTILQALADKVDRLIVGGGIANTFMLAAGMKIGRSLAEPSLVPQAAELLEHMRKRGAAVPLPIDVVTAKACSATAIAHIKNVAQIEEDDLILDIGPQSAQRLADDIAQAGTVVWNGPVGVFEIPAFSSGTETVANAIANTSAYTLAGGGDTLAAISQYGLAEKIDYISTGGGAFLEFLEGKTLPAVAALMERGA